MPRLIAIVICLIIVAISETSAQRNRNITLDLGKLFRVGLLTGQGGSKLGLNVLNGLSNVEIDRQKYPTVGGGTGVSHSINVNRPVTLLGVQQKLRDKIRQDVQVLATVLAPPRRDL
ncbi:unnamed protein product [Medioppia subpectinata]|uniref:Uncharacterized protein n=1 Tax=Medioppia subpectinata TaxID=1979941 RepID=A0A7R9KXT8_9ACAR|nr:unnamed protein product [Medioppia subpectinata]CAG2110769.1 unnamed protein product [Medioppia subpectinata]